MRPILLALAALVVAFVAGIVLMLGERYLIGTVVMLVGLPVAFGIWLTANDRA
jgi:hypothetical protein